MMILATAFFARLELKCENLHVGLYRLYFCYLNSHLTLILSLEFALVIKHAVFSG